MGINRLIQEFKRDEDTGIERMPINRVSPSYKKGLNQQQVQERTENGWTNARVDGTGKTVREIILSNLFTYFNLIFLVLSILLITVGSFRNLTFLPVIIANIAIGIVQEIRAKNVLDKMNMLNAPHTSVIRNGEKSVIDSEQLVIDDIVIFSAGNQICADAVVVNGNVQVNESLLTGESDDIQKSVGDRLMSGSYIVSGNCYARLEQVGSDSYISKLSIEAKTINTNEQSEMIRSLDWLLKWVGIIIIPVGIMLVWQGMVVNNQEFGSAVTAMVAAVIGMIPEGLYLLTSVALALSTIRLASKNVLLHDMKSIETLARVNILCVDKTGTITENKMTVQESVPIGIDNEQFRHLMGDFVGAMSNDNITMEALKGHFLTKGKRNAVDKTSFSSALKYSSVTFEDGVYVLGAPEMVLRDKYQEFEEQINSLSKGGGRVLVFAGYNGKIDGKPLTAEAVPLGFVVLANSIRENAKSTFKYFVSQGVAIKVISGDNPYTVSQIAEEAGIKNADRYIDARTLESEKDIYRAAKIYTVFGRVTPEQKRMLVNALKKQGNTVAMTGDGVNDVLALKDADCSIAMASGSEAAAQAAQVVLLDSDFSKMPSVVYEGRRVVNNIQRSASLFLVKNIFSFFMAVCSILFMITYPLEPSQISLISTFTIGIPGFFLALEPNRERIKGKFMKKVLLKALPGGLTDLIAVGALVLFGYTFDIPAEDISTAATLLLSLVGFMILYKICKPLNRIGLITIIGCIIGLVFSSVFLDKLFYMSKMSKECVMLAVVFAIATESVFRYLSMLFGRINGDHEKYIRKKNLQKKIPQKKMTQKKE